MDEDDDRKIDKNTIRELMSYEMLMQLVLNYLRDRKKDFRMSVLNIGSEQSKTSIWKKDEDYVDDEEGGLNAKDLEEEKDVEDKYSNKNTRRKNKHFIDGIHDSDEEDS